MLEGIQPIQGVLILIEEALLARERCIDVIIKQERGEGTQLALDVQVHGVDVRGEDSQAVRAYGVRDLRDSDRVDLFAVCSDLYIYKVYIYIYMEPIRRSMCTYCMYIS